ncbi:hypothetical protein HNO51_03645 [Billgrantia sulfidoxydans]|uniref:Uncharacterized protein n=1 Tax=Billgrantia sulfidoxydans TaxID=2733484 RepID=A0ABX7W0Z7_9GAMM|nr:hypothetical protein [Halomonas sulfidoxydans]QTP53855.1 hypothetical protein HNO51_03645 [Halomonas sulfidoxydans]
MSLLAQIIAYIVSPLATLLAVWIAYLAVLRGSQPQLLIYYQPNPDIPSLIDLVVENIGGGSAIEVTFSEPLPINWFGIEKPQKDGFFIPEHGFPAVSAGQRYVFNGGQYSGLESKLGVGLEVKASYKFRNPFGILRKASDSFILSISHLKGMPTRTSAHQAIVDALKGPNKTTIQEIRNELRAINNNLKLATMQREKKEDDIPT